MVATLPSGSPPPAAAPDGSSGSTRAGRFSLSRVAWLPVPLFMLAIVALKLDEPKAAFEHPYLLLLLNFVFSTLASAFVIALLARTFVMHGTADLLLFGCGLSFWALGGLVGVTAALTALEGSFDNTLITVHNVCVWLAGAGQLAGAALVVRPGPLIRRTGLWLTAGHVVAVATVGVVVIAAVAGWTPAFFIPGRGGTMLRQALMYSASAMFGTAAVLILRPLTRSSSGTVERRRLSSFESWYAVALALIAVGLLGVTLQTVVGGPLGWVGRSAQFLSGIYLVVAATVAVRQSRLWGLPLVLAAREAAERGRLLVEAMTEGFALHEIVTDDQGRPCDYRFLQVNPAFERLTGLKASDLIGRRVREVLPGLESHWIDRYGRVALTGEPARFESHSAPLGRWYDVFAYRHAPAQCAVIFSDITERKRIEQALRESEERLRLAQASARVGIWDWNPKSGTLSWTPELERIYGFAEGAFPGTYAAFRDRVHPEDVAEMERGTDEALRARRPFDLDFRVLPPAGETTWVNCKGAAVYDEAGQPGRVFGVNVDITERKRAEELARERLAEIENLYRNAPVGLCELDLDLRFVRINERLAEINGVPAAEHLGRRVRELLPALADAVEPGMRRVLDTGQPRLDIEIVAETPARPGVERSWIEQWLPLKDAEGRVTGLSIVVEETTERRLAAEALRQLNADLEQRVASRTAELARAVEEVGTERQRFLDVLETLPVLISLIRQDYRVAFANRAWRDVLGETRGLTCYESHHGRGGPCEECQAFFPRHSGQPQHWEWTRPGGRTFDIHCFPFTDSDGSPMVLEMDIDITERRRAERELHVAHAELAARAEQLRRLAGELTLAEQRERRRLAKVLHDHLQQLLAAARLRTAVLGRSGEGLVAQAAGEIKELLDLSIEAARSLTAETQPADPARGGAQGRAGVAGALDGRQARPRRRPRGGGVAPASRLRTSRCCCSSRSASCCSTPSSTPMSARSGCTCVGWTARCSRSPSATPGPGSTRLRSRRSAPSTRRRSRRSEGSGCSASASG